MLMRDLMRNVESEADLASNAAAIRTEWQHILATKDHVKDHEEISAFYREKVAPLDAAERDQKRAAHKAEQDRKEAEARALGRDR